MKKLFFLFFAAISFNLLLSQSIYKPEGMNMPENWDSWQNPPSLQ
jgi:hypothetical protein